jgi:hypothetical protein
MAQQEFIPYEQVLELKELGFNEKCLGYYNIDPSLKYVPFNPMPPFEHEWCLPTPLYQQAFRWFREKHNIVFYLNMVGVNLYYYVIGTEPFLSFKTYEEAELACLKQLIEIVKNK